MPLPAGREEIRQREEAVEASMNSRKGPGTAASSWGVPRWATRAPARVGSRKTTSSAWRTVDRRWATTMTVRPSESSRTTSVMADSFSPSRAEVISSSSRMGASLTKAWAMATR